MPKAISYVPDQSLPREVAPPPTVAQNEKAREYIRAWFDGSKIDVAIHPKVAPRPEAVGIILADIVKHTCLAYAQAYPAKRGDKAEKIMEVLLTELGAVE